MVQRVCDRLLKLLVLVETAERGLAATSPARSSLRHTGLRHEELLEITHVTLVSARLVTRAVGRPH